MNLLTEKQLRTLQTLYSKFTGHSLEVLGCDGRTARLAWAAQHIGRDVSSFKELRADEAGKLIEILKIALGQPVSKPRRRLSRDAAQAAGTHGRRGRKVKVEMMATPTDRAAIEHLREEIGMTKEGFDAWLRSAHSPLCGRGDPRLLTVSDCNRVRWALKAMLGRVTARRGTAPEVQKVSAAM